MTGSILDGEDVVQEALFHAYRRLDTFDESRPIAPWLFGIAHNRSIDFLRRREVRLEAEAGAAVSDRVMPDPPDTPALGRAVEHLVLTLPPMERACVLLKDVFDYSLEEVAGLVDATVGGVKSALNRGRTKLANTDSNGSRQTSAPSPSPERLRLLRLYVDRFSQKDWDGLRQLISSDAHLRVMDRFNGPLHDARYFKNYEQRTDRWKTVVGVVDGETVILLLGSDGGGWRPLSCVRIEESDGRIERISDYVHCPWMLAAAESVSF
jgi:RNA polymerase sigma-70 factor (ECF subfamily)